MNVGIGTEAAQFLFLENINGIFVAVKAALRRIFHYMYFRHPTEKRISYLPPPTYIWRLSCLVFITFFKNDREILNILKPIERNVLTCPYPMVSLSCHDLIWSDGPLKMYEVLYCPLLRDTDIDLPIVSANTNCRSDTIASKLRNGRSCSTVPCTNTGVHSKEHLFPPSERSVLQSQLRTFDYTVKKKEWLRETTVKRDLSSEKEFETMHSNVCLCLFVSPL